MPKIIASVIIVLMVSAALRTAIAADEPTATPYRPTVSTPAALSEAGWLELEAGGQQTSGGASSRRESIPYTLKLAFTPDWGVRIGGEGWVRDLGTDGTRLSGFGDTAFIVKRRFALNDKAAFGLEGGVNFPTAKEGLGSEKANYLLTGIYSADLGEYHTDLNLSATRFGKSVPDEGRIQTGWAASLSRPLANTWGVAGEFSGTYQKGIPSTAQFLAAVSYNYSKRVVFDAGVAAGLNRASADWSLFAGVTLLINKVHSPW